MKENVNTETPMVSPTQLTSAPAMPTIDNKKSSGLKIATAVAFIVAVCGISFGIYGMLQNSQKDKEIIDLQNQISNLDEQIKNAKSVDGESLISDTTWIASGGSEVVFSKKRINWYQNPEEHSDNYYSGVYKFYIGKEAVDYITKDLSEYGITKNELGSVFDSNIDYSEDNFVVFDIRYDKFILDGEEQEIARPLVPWYGFILEDNTYLDVANMNTGTYYKFTKSS